MTGLRIQDPSESPRVNSFKTPTEYRGLIHTSGDDYITRLHHAIASCDCITRLHHIPRCLDRQRALTSLTSHRAQPDFSHVRTPRATRLQSRTHTCGRTLPEYITSCLHRQTSESREPPPSSHHFTPTLTNIATIGPAPGRPPGSQATIWIAPHSHECSNTSHVHTLNTPVPYIHSVQIHVCCS